MRAIVVEPGVVGSVQLEDVPEPDVSEGALLVRALALGVCGTDREIIAGLHGKAAPGRRRLVLGHESLGVVQDAPRASGFVPGEHVVGIVRRPDPLPCVCCAAGEWDMCRNGGYTERGIKGRNGYGSERFRIEPEFAMRVDPALGIAAVLLEPTTIVAKAWDHCERIRARAASTAFHTVLVTGAGPVGFLAALLARQRGLDVHLFDRAEGGVKPRLAAALGAHYHHGAIEHALREAQPDVVLECTGATAVIGPMLARLAPNAILCLLGISAAGAESALDLGATNRALVTRNQVVFGAVNANRAHYAMAAAALAAAERGFLDALITRRIPLSCWRDAFEKRPGDIKSVIDFTL